MAVRYTSLSHAFFSNCPTERSPDACWEWRGRTASGYGIVGFRGGRYLAHRLSYELHKGPIAEGMHVCHSCDNPLCVNPTHLWLGTNSDNMADKIAKGRQGRVRGPRQASAKLNVPKVYQIRRLAREGVSQSEIAKRFNISQTNVSRIVQRKAWNFVP